MTQPARHSASPLHRGAGQPDRDGLAGPLGAGGHLPRAEPDRPAGRRLRPRRRPAEPLRDGHVPVPVGRRPARRPPAGLHRHRRLRPLPADGRRQRAAHDGLRRVRPARRAVRDGDRAAPADHHRGQHRQHTGASCAGWDWATTSAAASPPPTSTSTAGPSGSSCRSSTPGTTPARAGPGRSPSWWPSSTPGRSRPRAPTRTAGRGPSCPRWSAGTSSTPTGWPTGREAPVNWCPGLGTVLANEEVTADGRSERGNFPVFRRPLTQWMLRITAYADRLLDDLDRLDWPESIKPMQRNWIGRSERRAWSVPLAAPATSRSSRPGRTRCSAPRTWCWRPEHPLVDAVTADRWPTTHVRRWTGGARRRRGRRRVPAAGRAAVRAGAADRGPGQDRRVHRRRTRSTRSTASRCPIFVADYVLMGYGTGAIMAVPGARPARLGVRAAFDLPVASDRAADRVVEPHGSARHPAGQWPEAYTGDGVRSHSANAEVSSTGWASRRGQGADHRLAGGAAAGRGARSRTSCATGCSAGSATGASRSRSSTTSTGLPIALPESMLPVELPEIDDFSPDVRRTRRRRLEPEPPLSRLDRLGRGRAGPGRRAERRTAARPTRCRSGPARAGTRSATWTRPTTSASSTPRSSGTGWARPPTATRRRRPVRRRRRARRAAPAVRPLLAEGAVRPGPRVGVRAVPPAVQPGLHPGRTRTPTSAGFYVPAARGRASGDGGFTYEGQPVTREFGKMGKCLKNSVTPDEMYAQYGADTLRLYEMFDGSAGRSPGRGTTRRSSASYRLLQRVWRNVVDEETGAPRVVRRRRPTTRPGGRCTGPSRRCATTWRGCGSTPRSPGSPS